MTQSPALRRQAPLTRREATARAVTALREARRARNRALTRLLEDLRCECARPECRATVPAAAEAYRGSPERFIVLPDHGAGERVVAAADRFLVVEPPRRPQGMPAERAEEDALAVARS